MPRRSKIEAASEPRTQRTYDEECQRLEEMYRRYKKHLLNSVGHPLTDFPEPLDPLFVLYLISRDGKQEQARITAAAKLAEQLRAKPKSIDTERTSGPSEIAIKFVE